MQLKILCPQWGHEHLEPENFFHRVKTAGYDGVEAWMPENAKDRSRFIRLLYEYDLLIVAHQHQATGHSIEAFCRSYEYYLHMSAECGPLFVNSHSGRDSFTLEEQLLVIDTAQDFSIKNNINIVHETHRGRIGFCPGNARELFMQRPAMKITADLSHWVCVTESYLEYFQSELATAIERAGHIHARVGHTQGPQIPDPANPFWQKEVAFFLQIWQKIFDHQRSIGTPVFTATTEFGPPPYMWTHLSDNTPVASQWNNNIFMKDLLIKTFNAQA